MPMVFIIPNYTDILYRSFRIYRLPPEHFFIYFILRVLYCIAPRPVHLWVAVHVQVLREMAYQ